jgi:hypothetical protein
VAKRKTKRSKAPPKRSKKAAGRARILRNTKRYSKRVDKLGRHYAVDRGTGKRVALEVFERSLRAELGWYERLERKAIQEEPSSEQVFDQFIPSGMAMAPLLAPTRKVSKREALRALARYWENGVREDYDTFREYKRALFQREMSGGRFGETGLQRVVSVLYQMALDAGFEEVIAARFSRLS